MIGEQQPWSAEDVARARALWDEGVVTSEIARRLGRTKNSVSGLRARQGWERRQEPVGGRKPEKPAKPKPADRRRRVRVTLPVPVPVPRPPEPAVVAPVAPVVQPVRPALPGPVVPARLCQYPRGSKPAYDFCLAPVADGSPYCGPHTRLCWIVPPRRREAA